MTADIRFPARTGRGDLRLLRPTAVHIESGWEMLTDTATITMPRNVKEFNKPGGVRGIFGRGDQVTIDLGVDGKNRRYFTGYVTSIGSDVPVVLHCEDAMWPLKMIPVNMAYSGSLQGLLKAIVPSGTKVDAADIQLQKLKFVKMTAASVLKWLVDNYGIYSYFKGDKLVSGKVYVDDHGKVALDFGRDIKKAGTNLEWVRADELRVKVSVSSIRPDGSKITVTEGDEDGVESKFEYYGKHTESELKAIAKLNIERLKVDGYQGQLVTWGAKHIDHGMVCDLSHPQYPERNGGYYADAVTVDWDTGGFTHAVKIGRQS